MYYNLGLIGVIIGVSYAFMPKTSHRRVTGIDKLMMSSLAPPDLNLAALPTVEEWLDVCDPQLKKVTTAMFRAVKEISYKVCCSDSSYPWYFVDETISLDVLSGFSQ